MNIFSNKFINIISIIISIIIFLIINLIFNNSPENNLKNNFFNNNLKIVFQKNKNENNKINNNEKNIDEEKSNENLNWYVQIDAINLKAPIRESTTDEVLNTTVGHFEETPLTLGNVGLAGHNRGYEKNYFKDLKHLKKGDEIFYKYNEFEKTYIIDVIEKIKNTNWNYLDNTNKNKITLITCIENEPDFRLCIQATEKNDN